MKHGMDPSVHDFRIFILLCITRKRKCYYKKWFEQLKRRFPVLNYTVALKINRYIDKFIMCGFILHNYEKFLNDPCEDFQQIDVEEELVMRELNTEPNNTENSFVMKLQK